MARIGVPKVVVAVLSVTMLVVLAAPVMAELARLNSIPLGRGSATISWTGDSGITPTISSIHGSARGLAIVATGTVPKPSLNEQASGSTSLSIPSSVPLADIKGTISGTTFTLDVSLKVSGLNLSSKGPHTFGTVMGSFRGQQIEATLSGRTSSSTVAFRGSIGNDNVAGTIDRVVHHGKQSIAYATFDVTRQSRAPSWVSGSVWTSALAGPLERSGTLTSGRGHLLLRR